MKKKATELKIALYARVSTRDKGQDHENQLRELREFVERKKGDGWVLAQEYVDKISGKTADRPAFRKMFDAASRKEFDVVLFWSLDRFSREGVLEALQHLKVLTGHGVEWFSYREEYLRSIGPFRDAVLAILAAIAKQERVRRPERVLALRARGLSLRAIAAETGVSVMTVQRIVEAA